MTLRRSTTPDDPSRLACSGATGDRLLIFDPLERLEVASHMIILGKGHIVKNTDHYRERSARIADHEASIKGLVGDSAGRQLCELIKQTSPKIYKDQLAGVRKVLKGRECIDDQMIARVIDRPRLTATQLQEYVDAFERHPEAMKRDEGNHRPAPAALLSRYSNLANKPHSKVTR